MTTKTSETTEAQTEGTEIAGTELETEAQSAESTETEATEATGEDTDGGEAEGTETETEGTEPEAAAEDESGKPEDDAESGESEEDSEEQAEDAEEAAEDSTPVFAILPKRGSMTPREMLGVAKVVFGVVRTEIAVSSALGARRLMPSMSVPEGWELGTEVATRHFANKAPCGTWRIDSVFTLDEADGTKVLAEHLTEGPDPKGRGGSRAKDLVIVPFKIDERVMVNRVMGDGLTVSEKALDVTLRAAVKARKDKADADREAKKAQAALDAAAVTADAVAEQQAIKAYRAEAELVKAAGDTPMDELPQEKDARIELLISGAYLERTPAGRLIFTGEEVKDAEGGNDAEADSAAAESPVTVPPAPQPPADPARGKHTRGGARNRQQRQPLRAGAQGNTGRA